MNIYIMFKNDCFAKFFASGTTLNSVLLIAIGYAIWFFKS